MTAQPHDGEIKTVSCVEKKAPRLELRGEEGG